MKTLKHLCVQRRDLDDAFSLIPRLFVHIQLLWQWLSASEARHDASEAREAAARKAHLECVEQNQRLPQTHAEDNQAMERERWAFTRQSE
jgi:hypothetical protein